MDAEPNAELAPLLAEGLDEVCRNYAELSAVFAIPPSDEQDERLGCESIRRQAGTFSDALARLSHLANETVIDLDGRPFPPPRGIVKAFNTLVENYRLMRDIESYDDLMNQPLVPWPEIEAELQKPECQEWMKKALAAYPLPEQDEMEAK